MVFEISALSSSVVLFVETRTGDGAHGAGHNGVQLVRTLIHTWNDDLS
jgi:hypothetical protein